MSRASDDLSSAEGTYISTARAARVLRVSVTTVKRWVDEGILPAYKTPGGHRKLLMADVLRVAREVGPPAAPVGDGPPAEPCELVRQLLDAILAGDGGIVRAILVHEAYRKGVPVEILADRLVAPVMRELGERWACGRIDVLHEHRGTQFVASALYELKVLLEANAERDRPIAVGGAPEHDHYFLATLLAQLVLIDAGWEAINLGPHTPMSSLQVALTAFRPRLVWVSVSHLVEPERFLAEYREFYALARRADVAVAVGGRALADGLRLAMPYTTYGDGLTQLAAFAQTLHPRPRPPLRGRPCKSDSG